MLKLITAAVIYIIATALLLGMPLFVIFGALSDRIGRKRIMMAGCIFAVLTYLPIYHAMQSAAGSNVETAVSRKDPITGAVSLTPQTRANGVLENAKEVLRYTTFGDFIRNTTAWKLVLLVLIQVD